MHSFQWLKNSSFVDTTSVGWPKTGETPLPLSEPPTFLLRTPAVSNCKRIQHHDGRQPVLYGDRVGSCVCVDAVTDSLHDRSCDHKCSDDDALASRTAGCVCYRCFLRVARTGASRQASFREYAGGGVRGAGRSAVALCNRGAPNQLYDAD